MDRNTALVIIATIVVIVVMVYLLIKFGIIHRRTTTTTTTSTITTSPTITITTPTTTCNITCPPGYSVDPLLCICSPLVPYNIVVQPLPTFNIRLWLALGLVYTTSIQYYDTIAAQCSLQGKYISPGKACMGVLSNTTSCCPSSSPTCGCELCDPTYGCNPQTAQTSGTVSFYATVISSNGTPIPNTQVNVQSPLPMTIDIPLSTLGQWGTIQLTLQPPPQSIQTDENGNAIITVPFTAKLTYYNYALADLLLGGAVLQTLCNYSKTLVLQFNLSIPDTAIVVPAFVQTNVSVCVHVN